MIYKPKPFFMTPGFASLLVVIIAAVIILNDRNGNAVVPSQAKVTGNTSSVTDPVPVDDGGGGTTPTPTPIPTPTPTPVTDTTKTDDNTSTPTDDTGGNTSIPTGDTDTTSSSTTGTTTDSGTIPDGTSATGTTTDADGNVINPTLTTATQETAESPNEAKIFGASVTLADNPIAYTVATAASAIFAALAGSIANAAASSSSLAQAIVNLWNSFLTWLGFTRRRKEHRWGTVIEDETRLPLANTLLSLERIVKDNNGRVSKIESIANTRTDDAGAFGFIVEPGQYQLNIKKPGYHIVGDDLKTSSLDLNVTSENFSMIIPEIRMSAGTEVIDRRVSKVKAWNTVSTVLRILTPVFLTIGSIFMILNFENSTRYKILMLVYIVFWVYWLLGEVMAQRRSPWGSVTDTRSNGPIPLALVRVMDKDQSRLLRTTVSNRDGKYNLLLNQADYSVIAYKPGYEPSKPINVDVKDRLTAFNQKITLTPNS